MFPGSHRLSGDVMHPATLAGATDDAVAVATLLGSTAEYPTQHGGWPRLTTVLTRRRDVLALGLLLLATCGEFVSESLDLRFESVDALGFLR